MSTIDDVPGAQAVSEACDTKVVAQHSYLSSMKEELSEVVGQTLEIKTYFEELAGMMNANGVPAFSQGVAAEKAEDITNELAEATSAIEALMNHLEAIHDHYEVLTGMCGAIISRD